MNRNSLRSNNNWNQGKGYNPPTVSSVPKCDDFDNDKDSLPVSKDSNSSINNRLPSSRAQNDRQVKNPNDRIYHEDLFLYSNVPRNRDDFSQLQHQQNYGNSYHNEWNLPSQPIHSSFDIDRRHDHSNEQANADTPWIHSNSEFCNDVFSDVNGDSFGLHSSATPYDSYARNQYPVNDRTQLASKSRLLPSITAPSLLSGDQQSGFAHTGNAFRRNIIAPKPSRIHSHSRDSLSDIPDSWNDIGYGCGMYDFNDLNHSFHGYDDPLISDWSGRTDDNFWNNDVADNTTFGLPSTRNVFGFSDSMYLNPSDCEGMSAFNTGCGVYAPMLTPTMMDGDLTNRTRSAATVSSGHGTASHSSQSSQSSRQSMSSQIQPLAFQSQQQSKSTQSRRENDHSHSNSSGSSSRRYSASSNHDVIDTDFVVSMSSTSSSHLQSLPSTSSDSSISPPVHLSRLWQKTVFRSVWDAFSTAQKIRLLTLPPTTIEVDSDVIKRRIEKGIQEKKACRITRARAAFVELSIEFVTNVQVWLEFCRLEMECGEYENARVVLETACSQHPHNEMLLQKRLRVEERLRSIGNLIELITELRFIDTQKSLKTMVEGVVILAKLGYEKMAHEYLVGITTVPRYYTGNLYLELMICEQRAGSDAVLQKMIQEGLQQFPKYGPLWFFCFDLMEHNKTISWNGADMSYFLQCENFDSLMEMANANLTADILWKVLLYRVEYWFRVCMYSRAAAFQDPNRINELLRTQKQIYDNLLRDIILCINICPEMLLWKLFMAIGRYSNLVGFRTVGKKFMQRAYRLVSPKSRHCVILECSKLEYFARHFRCSLGLLNHGITVFPTEWRLLLERIQQLVLKEQYSEALKLNVDALKRHIGAGRLWSSYIHIVHQMFGPDMAMLAFRDALQHVAKSGEVWCEGARVYMNPTSRHFNLLNAAKCLNFAVFFTPQYGDSFIEAIRLTVLSSDIFLAFHSISSPFYLDSLLRSLPAVSFLIKRSSYFDPNYGPLWFRCQEHLLSPPKEVLYRSYHLTVQELSSNAQIYYEALMRSSHHINSSRHHTPCSCCDAFTTTKSECPISTFRKQFSYSFKPEYMFEILNPPMQMIRQMKILYGASQMDS